MQELTSWICPSPIWRDEDRFQQIQPYINDKTFYKLLSKERSFLNSEIDLNFFPFEDQSAYFAELQKSTFLKDGLAKLDFDTEPKQDEEIMSILRRYFTTSDEFILYVSFMLPLGPRDEFILDCMVVDDILQEPDIETRFYKYFLSALNFFQSVVRLNQTIEVKVSERIFQREHLGYLERDIALLEESIQPGDKRYLRALQKWTSKIRGGQDQNFFELDLKPEHTDFKKYKIDLKLKPDRMQVVYDLLIRDEIIKDLPFDQFYAIFTSKDLVQLQSQNPDYRIQLKAAANTLHYFLSHIDAKKINSSNLFESINKSRLFYNKQDNLINFQASRISPDKLIPNKINQRNLDRILIYINQGT